VENIGDGTNEIGDMPWQKCCNKIWKIYPCLLSNQYPSISEIWKTPQLRMNI